MNLAYGYKLGELSSTFYQSGKYFLSSYKFLKNFTRLVEFLPDFGIFRSHFLPLNLHLSFVSFTDIRIKKC